MLGLAFTKIRKNCHGEINFYEKYNKNTIFLDIINKFQLKGKN